LSASFAALTPARTWFENNTADVLLTDLALPDGHGLTLIRELAERQPECDILVVSVFGDEDTVIACVEAGAVGYIHKDSTPADVRAGHRRCAAGSFADFADDRAQAARALAS
jgi:DNA-binding NarL/FixJ family response regulator